MRRTKIVATLGPGVKDEEKIKMLLVAGVDIFRLNVAHGTVEEHRKMFETARKIANELSKATAIMLDIKGPEIRVSEARKRFAKNGEEITIGPGGDLELNREAAYEVITPQSRVLLHDGDIEIIIEKKMGEILVGKVLRGGIIAPHMGVNIPGAHIPIPYVQERDLKFLREIRDADIIAASFVRNPSDVLELRKEMIKIGCEAIIVAKIENEEGVENIDDILEVSDGIMVARGDLGTEIPVENLPAIQKNLVEKAIQHGKPSIIATQILESMIRNSHPTRAEVSDIANAILDGTDALMLSGETAIGKYPVEAVRVLSRVAEEAEKLLFQRQKNVELRGTISEYVSDAAVSLARDIGADALLILTRSGKTARLISRHRIATKILAATYSQRVLRNISLYWGVRGFLVDKFEYADDAVRTAINTAESLGLVKRGDVLVIAGGEPSEIPGTTNFVWVQIVGDLIARGTGFGNKIIRGFACHDSDKCDILIVDELTDELKIGSAKGLVIKSKLYDPSHLRKLAAGGISIVAGTGEVKMEMEEITIDPVRGLIWK